MLAQLPPALQSLHLPLRLKLWDGNQFDLGPSPQVTILVKEPQLITQLTHPSMAQLGTASSKASWSWKVISAKPFGCATNSAKRCWPGKKSRCRSARPTTRPLMPRPSPITTTSPTISINSGSTRTWPIPAPTSANRTIPSIRPSRTSSTTCAASCACRRVSTCSTWVAGGAGCRVSPRASMAPRSSVSP